MAGPGHLNLVFLGGRHLVFLAGLVRKLTDGEVKKFGGHKVVQIFHCQ